MSAANALYPLALLYDRRCALCRIEMDALRVLDTGRGRLRFVDISADGFDPAPWGATLQAMNEVMHAVDASGRMHRGVDALRLAYVAVGRGALWAPTRWPVLRGVCDALYAAFARRRYAISGVAAPLLERVAAARLARHERRLRRCARGACELDRFDAGKRSRS